MKVVLNSEICKERPNKAAIGAFNASIGSGATEAKAADVARDVAERSVADQKQISDLMKDLSKVDKQLDKIGFDTPLQYGRGTQRLGHAQKKRDGLAQSRTKIRNKLYDLGIEI